MKRRITISVDEEVSDVVALDRVRAAIGIGRISKNETQYCYVTTFADGTVVYADKTRAGNDTFQVLREHMKG